jgi:hypothetical protein
VTVNYTTPKTPAELEARGKPFPAIGQVWRFLGNNVAPMTDELKITGLRWFHGTAQACFPAGHGVAGIEHMMENDAWVFVRGDNATINAARAAEVNR